MIRSARKDDVPIIAGLIRELSEYEKLSAEVVLKEADLETHLFGPRPFAEVLIAEREGMPVGFALFFHNFSTFLARPGIYLEDLFVKPAFRGEGHGRALFQAVAKLATERDCGRLEWAVLDWNEPAIRFYESFGAVGLKDWTVFRLAGEALETLGR